MMRGFVCFHTGRRPSIANIPPFVIAGLDPAIQGCRNAISGTATLDARIKSGHDNEERVIGVFALNTVPS